MSGYVVAGTDQGSGTRRTWVVCIIPTSGQCTAGASERMMGGVRYCCARHDEQWIRQYGQGARIPSAPDLGGVAPEAVGATPQQQVGDAAGKGIAEAVSEWFTGQPLPNGEPGVEQGGQQYQAPDQRTGTPTTTWVLAGVGAVGLLGLAAALYFALRKGT